MSNKEINEEFVGGGMSGYIHSFVSNERAKRGEDPIVTRYTHMIGVPMADCHKLMLELESVQRAVLYHCPLMVHACLPAAVTRMPLLYVDASAYATEEATRMLHSLLHDVIQIHYFNDNDNDDDYNERMCTLDGYNEDGLLPLLLGFHKLEIDGRDNRVLHTVVQSDKQLTKLQNMMTDLQERIHGQLGFRTMYPPNDSQSMESMSKLDDGFVPRIPFMRLPTNFDSHLNNKNSSSISSLLPEEGGNGISPLFWIKWMDDTFGQSVRLRDMGVYPRTSGTTSLDEEAFYAPMKLVALPAANDRLSRLEAKDEQYNQDRLSDTIKTTNKEEEEDDDDLFDVEENRKILESIYESSEMGTQEDLKRMNKEKKESNNNNKKKESNNNNNKKDDYVEVVVDELDDDSMGPSRASIPEESGHLDDWMKHRIKNIVENRPSRVAAAMASMERPKHVPPLEENRVFRAYHEGTLRNGEEKKTRRRKRKVRPLPPYPSREHFVGFWKMIRLPAALTSENSDDTSTDNLVLRVDGCTSGGPVLDPETNLRAVGGAWTVQADGDEVWLVIKLVVPPKKERLIYMKGLVSNSTLLAKTPISSSLSIGTNAFLGKDITTAGTNDEPLVNEDGSSKHLDCHGEVWIEDAVTKENRQDLGSFSLSKLSLSNDPQDYSITIPYTVGYTD